MEKQCLEAVMVCLSVFRNSCERGLDKESLSYVESQLESVSTSLVNIMLHFENGSEYDNDEEEDQQNWRN
tara:strand:- start:1536 stop:1745 length:210 start_codon:yes stop_codon:yes gene_type:complete